MAERHDKKIIMKIMPEDIQRKKVLFQVQHRGTRELELLLMPFALRFFGNSSYREKCSLSHSETLLTLFENFLKESEMEIMDWLMEREPAPAPYGSLIAQIQEAHRLFSLGTSEGTPDFFQQLPLLFS